MEQTPTRGRPRKPPQEFKQVTVRMEKLLADQVVRLAREGRRSLSAQVVLLLEAYLGEDGRGGPFWGRRALNEGGIDSIESIERNDVF